MKPHDEAYFEIAQDKDGWHWQLWAKNGQPLARNAIVYGERKHAIQAAKLVAANVATARVIVIAHDDD